jgi:DNA replication protein DnaC
MISHTTLERLRSFRIPGFFEALRLQSESTQYHDLSFEDRLTLLIDAEHTRRTAQRINTMLVAAKLPSSLSLEDVDFSVERGLKKQMVLELIGGTWLKTGSNLIIAGQTGVGKTFIASVIARSLCQRGVSVRFKRTHHWLAEFLLLEERRRFHQAVAGYRKIPLLIFDEWLRDPISIPESRLLLDLLDDRYAKLSCMFISQLPVASWHARFPDPTLADAILDRIVHNSIRFDLVGDSMRRLKTLAATSTETHVASLR